MTTIQPTETLVYYDGVVVFAGQDPIGGYYVGMIIDTVDLVDRYLVAGVRPDRLREFRSGVLDLRTLLLEAPDGEWYTTRANGEAGQPLELHPHVGPLLEAEFLPEDGFYLDRTPEEDFTLQQACERGNVVFEFSAEPPEASAEHRIRATTLATLLNHMQMLVKHAYNAALRTLPDRSRSLIDRTDGALMDVVVPASAGSFRVVLEAAKRPDLFGSGELARGLRRLDEVFASTDNPSTAVERLQLHRGHLAGSYVRLMQLLAEYNTGLWYSWAEPTFGESKHRGVSEAKAKLLVEVFSTATDLGGETVTIVGEFERVNRGSGDWGLLTEQGRRYGKVANDGPSLNGLTVGRLYRFDCIEEIEMVDATGREKHTLYLNSIESP